MSVLAYAKKLQPDLPDEQAVSYYLDSKTAELESDVTNRLYGIQNKIGTGLRRAGYQILRDFFEGDQWMSAREAGSAMNVVNFCRMAVDNYTFFLTQAEPEVDIPPRDPLDDIENARVKAVEDVIKDILEDNNWYNIFFDGVQNGSLLGDTMIFGPWYSDSEKRIRLKHIKKPEFIRIIWESADYDQIIGFIHHYYLSKEAAESQFGDLLREKNITLSTSQDQQFPAQTTDTATSQQEQRVLVREFWDESLYVMKIDNHVVKYQVHDQGFVPLIYIKNIPHPTEAYGISDIEDLLDPQKAYNEQDSDMQDIIKQIAFASIFGKNIDLEEIQAGVAKIYNLGEDSEVFPDPRNTNASFLQTYLADKKQNVDITAGIPDVFQGGKGVRDVTGRALSVLLTPINNRIRSKEKRWEIAMKDMVKNIELLLEKYVPEAKQLIQNWYKVDIFFPGTLIRDVTDELNKMIQKTQSQFTTMKNIGIASPKDEQALMKKELSDPQLAIELSRSPQMQLAIIQSMIAQARQNVGEQRGRAANQPTLATDQNQGGENPASAANVPVGTTATPEGAVAAAGSAGGNPALIPNA